MSAIIDNYQAIAISFATAILLFVFSGIGSLILGTFLAALRVGPISIMRKAAGAYVTSVRNIPLLVVLLFLFYAGPKIGVTFKFVNVIVSTEWGDIRMTNAFATAVVGLTLYTSCFVCESLRSGINAVPLGQAEAARAIGMPFATVMGQVVLPQAFRASLPPLASTLIALLKNTTVAIAITVLETAYQLRQLTDANPGDRWWLLFAFAGGFVILVEVVSFISNRIERRWRIAR